MRSESSVTDAACDLGLVSLMQYVIWFSILTSQVSQSPTLRLDDSEVSLSSSTLTNLAHIRSHIASISNFLCTNALNSATPQVPLFLGVREQRVTNLFSSILLGLSLAAGPIIDDVRLYLTLTKRAKACLDRSPACALRYLPLHRLGITRAAGD